MESKLEIESLRSKAKTLHEIWKIGNFIEFEKGHSLDELWVRLEDAEEAIRNERRNIIRKIQAIIQERIDRTSPFIFNIFKEITFAELRGILKFIKKEVSWLEHEEDP